MSAAHIFRCGQLCSFRDLGIFFCSGKSACDQVPNTLKSFYTNVTQLFRSWYNAFQKVPNSKALYSCPVDFFI